MLPKPHRLPLTGLCAGEVHQARSTVPTGAPKAVYSSIVTPGAPSSCIFSCILGSKPSFFKKTNTHFHLFSSFFIRFSSIFQSRRLRRSQIFGVLEPPLAYAALRPGLPSFARGVAPVKDGKPEEKTMVATAEELELQKQLLAVAQKCLPRAIEVERALS